MQEIFIPTLLAKIKKIQDISWEFFQVISLFPDAIVEAFQSDFLSGYLLQFDEKIPDDIISLCNGEFWKYYFLERLPEKNRVFSAGSEILWESKLFQKIPEISNSMSVVIQELKNEKLLTRTKMSILQNEITQICFTLSAVVFTLESLKKVSRLNRREMQSYSGTIEYEAQAEHLSKVSEIKYYEIEEMSKELYPKITLFLEFIQKI